MWKIKQGLDHLTRRDALKKIGVGAVTGLAMTHLDVYTISEEPIDLVTQRMADSEWSQIKGFNYQPSYGSTGFELWQKFDEKIIIKELERGKGFFPKMNALRWWQSWDSFLVDPKRYMRNFDMTLDFAERVGCRVMPCLFNRWHSSDLDYGGIYIDHFLPKSSWVQKAKMFDVFLEALVGRHKDNPVILAWDLCNEPYAYSCPRESIPDIVKAETDWLTSLYGKCKELGAQSPITVGIWDRVPQEMVDPICDILSIHPYWKPKDPDPDSRKKFEQYLDTNVAFALKTGKPLLATECCWGDLDDKVRAEGIRFTLTQLKKRNISWMAFLLNHSLIADSHRPEFGPIGSAGSCAFIEVDGTLRLGHDVFNGF